MIVAHRLTGSDDKYKVDNDCSRWSSRIIVIQTSYSTISLVFVQWRWTFRSFGRITLHRHICCSLRYEINRLFRRVFESWNVLISTDVTTQRSFEPVYCLPFTWLVVIKGREKYKWGKKGERQRKEIGSRDWINKKPKISKRNVKEIQKWDMLNLYKRSTDRIARIFLIDNEILESNI